MCVLGQCARVTGEPDSDLHPRGSGSRVGVSPRICIPQAPALPGVLMKVVPGHMGVISKGSSRKMVTVVNLRKGWT